jgi:hypothetical protein
VAENDLGERLDPGTLSNALPDIQEHSAAKLLDIRKTSQEY